MSAWRETWGRPSSLPSSLTAHRHERRRSEGWKEGKWEREALLCFVCHGSGRSGSPRLLASKNTSCTKHGFESTINARARPHDLEIQQQTVLIFIGSVAQLPKTSLSLSGNHLHANMSPPKRSLSKNMSLIMLNKRSKKLPFSY